MTGSVALYSDALESIVNLITALVALYAIHVSAQPADRRHQFGHHKAEYFSAVIEGVLIVVAALLIFHEAYDAFLRPRTLSEPLRGLAVNGIATAINAGWSYFLLTWGRRQRSPALVGDGWHLMTDVATSVGVIVGLLLAMLTGWQVLDPALAALVGANILWAGWRLVREVGERAHGRGRGDRGRGTHPAGDLRQRAGRHRGTRREDARRRPRDIHRVPPGGAGHHDGGGLRTGSATASSRPCRRRCTAPRC